MSNRNSCPFAPAPAIIAFTCLECLVVVQALLAHQDHFFTVFEMQQRGVGQGLPFVWHFGMWGDLLIVSGLAAYVICRHSFSWDGRRMMVSFAFGFSAAIVLSWSYIFSEMWEAHVQGHRLTIAGTVHCIYMGIVLSIFTQFFLFTIDVPVRLLRVTSLLLFIHVLLGMHMALGILSTIYPLAWYPAHPLRSVLGWITVGVVALGLAWRNIGTPTIVAASKSAVRSTFLAGTWLLHLHPGSAEGYLKTLDYFCGLVGFLYFGQLFVSGWRQGGNPWSLVLILLIGVVYYLSRLSVTQELDIARLLFPSEPDRFPDELKLKDRVTITFQVALFMALYLFLGWAAHNVALVSLCMFVIGCIDYDTRRRINRKMRLYFSDAAYAPLPDEKNYHAIQEKRAEVSRFLFSLPHLRKEGMRIAGFAVALGVAGFGYRNHNERLNALAYVILIGTLVLNEITALRWRYIRDRRLKV